MWGRGEWLFLAPILFLFHCCFISWWSVAAGTVCILCPVGWWHYCLLPSSPFCPSFCLVFHVPTRAAPGCDVNRLGRSATWVLGPVVSRGVVGGVPHQLTRDEAPLLAGTLSFLNLPLGIAAASLRWWGAAQPATQIGRMELTRVLDNAEELRLKLQSCRIYASGAFVFMLL